MEAGLNETIKTLEDGIATFSAYLKTRGELFKTDWELDEEENEGIASAIPGEQEGRPIIDIDTIRSRAAKIGGKYKAEAWIKTAREKAMMDILDEPGEREVFIWTCFRESAGVKP